MRQVLMSSAGAVVARMPRPVIEPGMVLVRTRYSMISAGTELAPLRGSAAGAAGLEKAQIYSELLTRYLKKAAANPRLAVRRSKELARAQLARLQLHLAATRQAPAPSAASATEEVVPTWRLVGRGTLKTSGPRVEATTDSTPSGYQILSQPIAVPSGHTPVLTLSGELVSGKITIGLLGKGESVWIGSKIFEPGSLDDRLVFDPCDSPTVTLVVANADGGPASLTLDEARLSILPPDPSGLPHSETGEVGWGIGYSAVGEVMAVGTGVSDLVPGDLVACAGAGRANHADFVIVPRNLAARVPAGCDLRSAAMTTIGAIALQGVRRAAPTLGETIAVLGLGLLGQLTVQLLRANGCSVVGLDLDEARVRRALAKGLAAGASDPEAFKSVVRDLTAGVGADRTLICASTKSDSAINLAMEITRRKGTVVIVGDVGLRIDRTHFYQKEIDLLISTSYGPGRYDRKYEEEGQDYPIAYVRWTENRNMCAFLDLVRQRLIDVSALIDRVAPIVDAPAVYRELAAAGSGGPIGVLFEYPADPRPLPQPADSPAIRLRGARRAPEGPLGYVLVGVGSFGTAMLVPQMAKRKDRFVLRGVVSRDAVRGGNFAREHRLEVLATDLDQVLQDESIRLVVIATRHRDHAAKTVAALRAGRHVFVEKPLALTWDDLDLVVRTYEELPEKPLLMVGFNRRFAPAMQLLRERLANRRSPLMINYRLNGGFIPRDHWIQSEAGGGRNLGEACHMYDCFRFLTGAPVADIRAVSIRVGETPYLPNDNFTASLSYQDGSVASLFYTALGPKEGLSKERIEVFVDGEAYVIDDFRSLTKAGERDPIWHASEADKGHSNELSSFGDAIVEMREAPIPFEEIIETSAVALHVEDLIFGRMD